MKLNPLSNKQKSLSKSIKEGLPIEQIDGKEEAQPKINLKTTKSKSLSGKKKEDERNAFTVVAIGASAGGLEAITQLLHNLSPTTGMAYIYVQHLSPDHKSMLTSLLSKATTIKVQDVENMDKIEPD